MWNFRIHDMCYLKICWRRYQVMTRRSLVSKDTHSSNVVKMSHFLNCLLQHSSHSLWRLCCTLSGVSMKVLSKFVFLHNFISYRWYNRNHPTFFFSEHCLWIQKPQRNWLFPMCSSKEKRVKRRKLDFIIYIVWKLLKCIASIFTYNLLFYLKWVSSSVFF